LRETLSIPANLTELGVPSNDIDLLTYYLIERARSR